jgi:hypothetical protein
MWVFIRQKAYSLPPYFLTYLSTYSGIDTSQRVVKNKVLKIGNENDVEKSDCSLGLFFVRRYASRYNFKKFNFTVST